MAHAIDQTTGRAAVFVTGEPAWHQLGHGDRDRRRPAPRLSASQDWIGASSNGRSGLSTRTITATEAGIPDTVANVRTDTKAVLGVVGKRYRVFQNHEAFDFMDGLVGDKLAMYETAGSLHGGKRGLDDGQHSQRIPSRAGRLD